MGDAEQMPKLNLEKDKVDRNLIDYMKIVEQQNRARVEKLQRLRRNNIWTGLALGIGVLSIYGYSIFSVKQETFLDDLDALSAKQ